MKAFIVGATGVLGHRVVAELVDRGHAVIGLTRDEPGDQTVREAGGKPRRGDILDFDTLVDAIDDADVVVHAATTIPTKTKPTAEDWALNDRIRREGTRNLLDAAEAVGADRFLMQSIVWLARRPDGSAFDEDAPPNPARTTQSAADAERIIRNRIEGMPIDAATLRCGIFYAPDAVHTRQFGRDAIAGDLPIVGGGLLGRRDAALSFVHVHDAARAFADAAEADATGLFHVVDDEPATAAAFVRGLADRLNAPEPSRVPGWLARFFVGPDAVRMLTNPMPTSNERFREAVGWTPDYSTIDTGLDAVVNT